MANRGFLGHRIGIGILTIQNARLSVGVQFIDSDDTVHAEVTHALSLDSSDDPIPQAVNNLLTLIERHVAQLHFSETDADEQEEAAHGIAEALRQGSADVSDGFEEGS